MRRLLLALALATMGAPVIAQVTIPNTLVSGTTIRAGDLNTNFSTLGNHALDRLVGGTISANITVDPGITIDGIDLSVAVCATCTATFKDLVLASPATGVTVAGNVIINSSGKIPALTSTYFTSLAYDAANLTGTVATARLGGGVADSTTFLRGDQAWAGITGVNVLYSVNARVALYTALTTDQIITANGTFTVTLYACTGNNGRKLEIKNIGTTTITVTANGAETIDGAASITLPTQYESRTLVCNSTNNWIII